MFYTRKEDVLEGKTVLANMKNDKDFIEWAKKEGLYVRIDRQTPFGNPFRSGEKKSRKEAVRAYKAYVAQNPPPIDNLKGKVLGCWCYPKLCHGNVLLDLIELKETIEWEKVSYYYQNLSLFSSHSKDYFMWLAFFNSFDIEFDFRYKVVDFLLEGTSSTYDFYLPQYKLFLFVGAKFIPPERDYPDFNKLKLNGSNFGVLHGTPENYVIDLNGRLDYKFVELSEGIYDLQKNPPTFITMDIPRVFPNKETILQDIEIFLNRTIVEGGECSLKELFREYEKYINNKDTFHLCFGDFRKVLHSKYDIISDYVFGVQIEELF